MSDTGLTAAMKKMQEYARNLDITYRPHLMLILDTLATRQMEANVIVEECAKEADTIERVANALGNKDQAFGANCVGVSIRALKDTFPLAAPLSEERVRELALRVTALVMFDDWEFDQLEKFREIEGFFE